MGMQSKMNFLVLFSAILTVSASAEKAGVKVQDIPTNEDTSIVIKKGAVNDQCTEYEILTGTEEVFGLPEFDRSKAMATWKTSCSEWKQ